MEYFLLLSVMAMIISSISIFLIDYRKPVKNTDPANDQPPSNPTELMEESANEFNVSESEVGIRDNQLPQDATESKKITIHSKPTKQKEDRHPFSFIWNTTHKSTFSI